MKKLVLLVFVVFLLLSGMPEYVSAAYDGLNILSDLTLLDQLESQELLGDMSQYSKELEYQYNESARVRKLMEEYVKPSNMTARPAMTNEILYVLGCAQRGLDDNSLLFRDDIFTGYYRSRTSAVLEEYGKSGKIDFTSFSAGGKEDFGKYLSEIQKDAGKTDRLTLLLQDKLIGRLYTGESGNKAGYFDEVLALRKVSGRDKRNQAIYELMESRVRLKLIEELVNINKDILETCLADTRVLIKNDMSGTLSFRYISDVEKRTITDYSVYMTAGNSGYKMVLPLGRLAAIYGKAAFTAKDSEVKLLSRDSIWSSMHMGAEGLEVNLAEAYISENQLPAYDVLSILPGSKEAVDIDKLIEKGKALGNGSKEAEKFAQEITKSLSALESYLDLKEKGISNAYTAKFEAGRGAWLTGLNTNFSRMNKPAAGQKEAETGYMGFLSYIRQYADYSRECAKAGLPQDSTVLKFRDTVLQFKPVDEGALWILDMLYKLKYIQ